MKATLLIRGLTLLALCVALVVLVTSAVYARGATTQAPALAGKSGQLSGTSMTLKVGQPTDLGKVDDDDPNAEFETGEEGQPPDPKDTPYTPKEKPTFDTSPNASQAAPLTIFRSTVANPNAGKATQEPTAANGGEVAIAVGNTWAQLSSDNGMTWPSTLTLNAAAQPAKGDTVCCDQLAYSVDRGDHTLFFWLSQDNCGTIQCGTGNPTKENAITLRVFKNGDKLLAGNGCQLVLKPSKYGIKNAWFDFNKMSSTNKFLYIATDVITLKGKSAGSEIIRFRLDKLDDNNHQCNPGRHLAWHLTNEGSLAPVEHADSTMYFAEHINDTNTKNGNGDELRIFSVDDSSTKLSHVDRDVNNFAPNTRGAGTCPSPDGNDTCKRFNDNQMVGFRSGKAVGWLWTAPQDSQFAFPQVRVAVFKIKGFKLAAEHAIYSPKFAWTYPAVGVNNRGEIGVIIYRMGGGAFPSPHAFIVKHPKNESEWSGLGLHVLATGQATAPSKPNTWGDYASVHAYVGCPNTFLGTAWSVQKSGTEDRVVWFGDPDDGCADLAVTGSFALPGRLPVGGTLSLVDLAKNLGSGKSEASETRYYLSKDANKSSNDVLLKGGTAVPALFPGGQFSPSNVTNLTIPAIAPGTYKLLDCANDVAPIVPETTLQNNCFSDQSITVT